MLSERLTGTVTFLFTDIEGSTDLLKQLRDGYAEVLAEHETVLRAAIDQAGGHVVDTQGDALFAAFPRAGSAVAAAVAGQRALAATPWLGDVTVRVRMGLHSGEPALSGERYVGLGVHRAARISAAAHGGQVLLSGATRALVEDELPGDVQIADLGEYRLKDIDRPERLYQLVVEGLPTDFPPPRTDLGEAGAVALAESAGRRRFAISRRSARALAATVVLAVAGIGAYVLTSGGTSRAAVVAPNSVGFIDARSGRVAGQVAVDQAPTSVVVGAGAVWAANSNAGTVSRIDPAHKTVQTVSVGASPTGIAVGGGGVWVANHDDGTVSWINEASNTVVRTITVGAGPTAVAYGFGSVWVTNAEDRTVTRIDATTGATQRVIPTKAVGDGLAVGGGSVWVTDEASRSVFGIDPTTDEIRATATVGAGPTGIAYGDGSIWVANSLDGTVSRVDATTLTTQATIPVAGGPSSVSFSRGAVWVSAEFGARVVRIDPRRDAPVGSTPIGNRPEGLAAGAGGVWVAVQSAGTGHRGGRLVVLDGGLDSIDPALASATNSAAVLATAYDGLTTLRRVGGAAGTQIVPDLASALPLPTAGGRNYTFRLRSGIRYSDGRPVRAVDFRRALMRIFDLNGPAAASFTQLVGAASCLHSRTHDRCDLGRGVVVEGPSTLTFRLVQPDPRFFFYLTTLTPVPAGTSKRDVGAKPVPSTGPYAIGSYVRGRLLTLVRNRYFHVWSAAARPDGYPDEIVYRPEKNDNTGVRDVLAGKADLVFQANLSGARVEELAARYPRQVQLDRQQATTFLFLNVRRPPFDDVRVRRAIDYAVDRQRIVELHGAALAQPTCQIVPPTLTGYRRYCPYTVAPSANGAWRAPDLSKARALIRASGTRGATIVVWSCAYFRAESEYIVTLLRRLGYRARLHYIADIGAYFTKLYDTPSAQAGLAGWFGLQLPIDIFRAAECRAGAPNWAHFCSNRLDAQIERLADEEPGDPAGSAPLAAAIDRELTDQAPWVPLFTPRLPDITSARVGNYQINSGSVLLDQLWLR